MRYQLVLEPADIEAVHRVIERYQNHPIVQARQVKNVTLPAPKISRDDVWITLMMCLLTTQNKSNVGSTVDKFLCTEPFPLSWEQCSETRNFGALIKGTLSTLRIRRWKICADFAQHNFRVLKRGGWRTLESWQERLQAQRNRMPIPEHHKLEREAAQAMQGFLKGLGPKQSRNFWQYMGLTRYEIPLDSRITRWVQSNLGFYLPSQGLADERFYCQVMDAIRELALAANVLPCMLDAAIFASYEKL